MKPFSVLSALLLMAYTIMEQVPIKKFQESPEYKELKKKFDKHVEELKKQKGIKEDKAFLQIDVKSIDLRQVAAIPIALKLSLPFAAISDEIKVVEIKALPAIIIK